MQEANEARDHLLEEMQSGWPEMSPYTGPIFDVASKLAEEHVYAQVLWLSLCSSYVSSSVCAALCARKKKARLQ